MKFFFLVILICNLVFGCSESTQAPPGYNGYIATKIVTTGVFDSTTTIEYDSKNSVLLSKIDRDSDGTIDAISSSYLNELGQVSTIHHDQDNDDVIDLILSVEFNDNNLPIKLSMDTDNDGTIDTIRHINWSEANRISSQRDENTSEGSISGVNTYDWSIDGQIVSELDIDNDGTIDSTSISYTNDSNYVHKRNYFDGERNLQNYDIFSYDEHGNLIKEEGFNSNDESFLVTTYTYEETSELISNRSYSLIDIGLRQ